jgi:hypothetical protein
MNDDTLILPPLHPEPPLPPGRAPIAHMVDDVCYLDRTITTCALVRYRELVAQGALKPTQAERLTTAFDRGEASRFRLADRLADLLNTKDARDAKGDREATTAARLVREARSRITPTGRRSKRADLARKAVEA